MPATALKEEPLIQTSSLRRFNLPDISMHGEWLLKRLLNAYPHLNDRAILGWIRNLLYDNANLFLYQDHGVALFQLSAVNSLSCKPEIFERFVFVMEGYAQEGAEFYEEAMRWAKPQGIEKIWVEEMTDVPHDLIKEKIGRIFSHQSQFVRV